MTTHTKILAWTFALAFLAGGLYALPASADHVELSQVEEYILNTDPTFVPFGSLTGAPACDWQGTGQNVGKVCFELTGAEHELGIFVDDDVQWQLYKLDKDAEDEGHDLGHFYWVRAHYAFKSAGGGTLKSAFFCGFKTDLLVPEGAASLEVTLDGPIFEGYSATSHVSDVRNQLLGSPSRTRPTTCTWDGRDGEQTNYGATRGHVRMPVWVTD